MLFSYLKIALRSLRKNSAYTFLNMLGLAISVCCSLLIFLLVSHHRSFDRHHPDKERIGRVVTDLHIDNIMHFGGAPFPMSSALRTEFACLEHAAMRNSYSDALIGVRQKAGSTHKFLEETGFAFVEPEIFEILHLPLRFGTVAPLSSPNFAIVTVDKAIKYFGEANAVGQTFIFNNQVEITIAGVMENLPDNTDYRDDILVSWSTQRSAPELNNSLDSWGGLRGDAYCWAKVRPGHRVSELTVNNPAFFKKYRHPDRDDLFQYKIIPISSLHLHSDYGPGTTEKYLWALTCIGIFLLITACVNFINMATAQALNRAREVGVRKSLGSTRGQLFRQFMLETGIIVATSVGIGAFVAWFSLPVLGNLTEQSLRFFAPGVGGMLLFLSGLFVVLTFAAGAYPGLLQSRFQAVHSLKGLSDSNLPGGFSLRRILVTSQFAISQILIIVAAVVTAQMQFAHHVDWGYRPGTIVTLPIPEESPAKMSVLRQQLSAIAGVQDISLCFQPPAAERNNQTGVRFDTRPEGENWVLNTKAADANYVGTFGLTLVAGRNIQPSDTVREYLVNETFIKKLNLTSPDDVLHKNIIIDGHAAPIVGVVKDYYNWSLTDAKSAIAFYSNISEYQTCAVAIDPVNPAPVIAQFRKIWESIYPNQFYEHQFQDEQIAAFMQEEATLLKLISAFAAIAILIGCLGLYGLSAFMVAKKRKEVGIRKTLGASIASILWIFSKTYLQLIIIAFVIAAPLGGWLMHTWLANYEYRITPGAGLFLLALLFSVLVATITVGFQSLKAALDNPVKSLRSE